MSLRSWFNRMHSKRLMSIWVVGGALLVACILLAFSVVILISTRSEGTSRAPVTAVFSVISAPTSTAPVLTDTPIIIPTPDSGAAPLPPPGEIAVGAYVQVMGTGGDGLRLRFDPGLEGQVRLLGSEAEVFIIQDGPRELDGYTWWYLVGPYDETRYGWAVSNFLVVVQNP